MNSDPTGPRDAAGVSFQNLIVLHKMQNFLGHRLLHRAQHRMPNLQQTILGNDSIRTIRSKSGRCEISQFALTVQQMRQRHVVPGQR